MADFRINTEVHKRQREITIYMTQGESTYIPYEIFVFDNQEALDLTGATVEYRATLPDGSFINQLVEVSSDNQKAGKIEWLPAPELTNTFGKIETSHFVITKDGRNIKTRDLIIDVTPTPDLDGEQAKIVVSQIDDVKNRVVELDTYVSEINERVQAIEDEITNNPDKFRGLKGDRGVQGLKGDTGEKGDKGDTGDVSLEQLESVKNELSNWFTPVVGNMNMTGLWVDKKINYSITGNVVTLTFRFQSNGIDMPDGDVVLLTLPTDFPMPVLANNIGFIVNVSAGTNVSRVGSLRTYKDGRLVVNWDNPTTNFSGYVEAQITYDSDRKPFEPLSFESSYTREPE